MRNKQWWRSTPKPKKNKHPRLGHYEFAEQEVEWVTFVGEMERIGAPPVSLNLSMDYLLQKGMDKPEIGSTVNLKLYGKQFRCIVVMSTDVLEGEAVTLTMQVIG